MPEDAFQTSAEVTPEWTEQTTVGKIIAGFNEASRLLPQAMLSEIHCDPLLIAELPRTALPAEMLYPPGLAGGVPILPKFGLHRRAELVFSINI